MVRLFVYGTLKRGRRNHGLVAGHLQGVIPGFVEGYRLFHLEGGCPYPYPGMVPGPGRVYGEVLLLPEEVLPLLDDLEDEGVEYQRKGVTVQTEEGPLEAWAYVYLGDVSEAAFLPEGVWPIVEP